MEYNLFKGVITHVIDPSNFWMRIGKESDLKLFDKYQEQLATFYNKDKSSYMCSIDQLSAGCLVVVSTEDQCHWKRAQVTRVDQDNSTADVFFVDLGYTAIVNVDDCRKITHDLFYFVAAQANRVSLAGIKPLAKSWTSRASSHLEGLKNQDVVTLLVNCNGASSSYSVVIYSRQDGGEWQSLVHQMQHYELALGTDDNIQEYLTDDLVNECLERLRNSDDHTKNVENGEDDRNVAALIVDEDEETEKWHMGAHENRTKRQGSTETLDDVKGFDYHKLMQTRSISISKMQQEKGWESQEQTKTKIAQGLQRMDSEASAPGDQDWDAVKEMDFDSDITNQIYQTSRERHESSDGLRKLLEESRTIECGPKKAKAEEEVLTKHVSNTKKEQTMVVPADVQEDEEAVHQQLTEMEVYQLNKEIKEILANKEESESDFICASVYSVVEPDVDTPSDRLKVVIYAILEHVIQNSGRKSEVAFAILETYSDASAFAESIIEVYRELKDRYLKKVQSVRSTSTHNKFAKMIALVFKHSEDWNSSVCKTVQDHVVNRIERWIVFNKVRRDPGDDIIKSEFMYLECAETFLLQCYDLMKSKYESELTKMISEIRWKLLHEGTPSWIRACLLELLLSLTSRHVHKEDRPTCNVATQTEPTSSGDDKRVKQFVAILEDKKENQEFPKTHLTDYQSYPHSSRALTDGSSQFKRKEKGIPKSIRNLPPRLFNKYLQDHNLAALSNHTNNDNDIDQQRFDLQASSPNYPSLSTADKSDNVMPFSSPSSEQYLSNWTLRYSEENSMPNEQNNNIEAGSHDKLILPKEEPLPAEAHWEDMKKYNCDLLNTKFNNAHVDSPELTSAQVYDNDPTSAQVYDRWSTVAQAYDMNFTNKQVYDTDLTKEEDCDTESTNRQASDTETTAIHTFSSQMNPKEIATTIGADSNESPTIMDENNHDSVGVPDRDSDNCHKVIKYTPQQLRDLNPFAGQPKLELWDLWEPKEVLEKMMVMVHPGKSDSAEKSLNWRRGRSDSPAKQKQRYEKESFELSTAKDEDVMESSVDPEENLFCGSVLSTWTPKASGNLQDIASELINPTESTPRNEVEDSSTNGDEEFWHDGDVPGPKGDFLKPKRNNDCSGLMSRKAKKKKGRGKPLDEFLQEKADLEHETTVCENDGENQDLFSPEAIEMYEELERQGIGNEEGDFVKGARVLMPSKIGSHVTSSSKHPSLFASVRSEQAGEAPKPWRPSRKRFCTNCGSDSHIVYDCPEHSSHRTFE